MVLHLLKGRTHVVRYDSQKAKQATTTAPLPSVAPLMHKTYRGTVYLTCSKLLFVAYFVKLPISSLFLYIRIYIYIYIYDFIKSPFTNFWCLRIEDFGFLVRSCRAGGPSIPLSVKRRQRTYLTLLNTSPLTPT